MRSLLAAGLLLVATLAGCMQAATDTDLDGLADERELDAGTDPKVADTDGDALSDGDEVDKTMSDPNEADTDGDHIDDGAEVDDGTDPLNPDDGGYDVPPVPQMDGVALAAEHARFVVAHPNRSGNSADHEAARQDLAAMFESYGLETYRMNFTTDGLDQANIVGIKWGVHRDRWVVVGGHYDIVNRPNCDSCPVNSQGAYDNGSGTMVTMALAKAYANATPYNTIAFVGMDGEERGTEGAAAFVDIMMDGTSPFGKVTFAGELDIDMLGLNWPGVNAPIDIITNSQNTSLLIHARAQAMGFPDSQLVDKDGLQLGSSDYVHFWRLDDPPVPTVFLISDFEELGIPAPAPEQGHTPASAGIYPFWHLEDTLASMRLAAGDPPADGVAHPNIESGFEYAARITAEIVHFMAYEPDTVLDAVPRN